MTMPPANRRIKELIDLATDGKVLPFLNLINEGRDDKISHQRLNRLFVVDSRTGSWPGVPHEILEAILLRFPDVDAHWLITGEKRPSGANSGALTLTDDVLQAVRLSLDVLNSIFLDQRDQDKSMNGLDQKASLGKKTHADVQKIQQEGRPRGNVKKRDI